VISQSVSLFQRSIYSYELTERSKIGHTVVRLSLRPRINRRRRRRRPFIRILGSARVQMQVILLFKNKFIRIFCLLEAISRKKLSQNSCSGFAFIPKRKDS
jgi:hypothetical protein